MHILFFDTTHTCAKTHSGFSMSLDCHVAFLCAPLRSLRRNWCCLFIIQGLNGSTMKICHSLSVMIALFHYCPSAELNHQIQPLVLSTSYFLLPVSHHESLTNQLVNSYLLLFQFIIPCTFWKILFQKQTLNIHDLVRIRAGMYYLRERGFYSCSYSWVGWIKPRSYGWFKWQRLRWSSRQ